MARLTTTAIQAAKPGKQDRWLTDDDGTRGGGRLVLRVGVTGSKLFYYRYTIDKSARRHVVPIGPFSAQPQPGRFTLEQARALARVYEQIHRNPATRDVLAYLRQRQEAEKQAVEVASADARRAEEERWRLSTCTVKALCERYVLHLKDAGKVSFVDARTMFAKNLYQSEWGSIAASDLTSKQVAALLRSVVERGKGRTAAKLRSYLRAAFQLALRAELDAAAPAELVRFGVTQNPVASTAALSSFNRTRDRVLSDSEMGALWRRLCTLKLDEDVPLQAARLALALGGQRPTQLLRTRLQDVDLGAGTLTLLDGKGRRLTARRHVVPLCGSAPGWIESLKQRSLAAGSDLLFASGKVHVVPKTISDAVSQLSADMFRAGELSGAFQARDLRRTAETMMARLGVSKDVRAQLQSHGLGGVQDRHYDRHDYMGEKRAALAAWQAHLARLAEGGVVSRPRPELTTETTEPA